MTFEQQKQIEEATEAGLTERTFRQRMEDVMSKAEKLETAATAMLTAAQQTKAAAKSAMREIE